jgi:anti-anti-sigma factor
MNLDITTETTSPESVTVRVAGDVDYATARTFVTTVASIIARTESLRDLRFDLTELSFCDSTGLSGFLQIQRNTSAVGIRLHLDNRPAHFDRLLDLTGLLAHLTSAPSDEGEPADERYEGGGSNN